MRNNGTKKDQRRHAQGNDALRVVNLFQNQVIAGLHAGAVAQVDPADGKTGQRQELDKPAVSFTRCRGPLQ